MVLEELQEAVHASPFGSISLGASSPGRHAEYLVVKVCYLAGNAPCTAFLALQELNQDLGPGALARAILHAASGLLRIQPERLAVWQVYSSPPLPPLPFFFHRLFSLPPVSRLFPSPAPLISGPPSLCDAARAEPGYNIGALARAILHATR